MEDTCEEFVFEINASLFKHCDKYIFMLPIKSISNANVTHTDVMNTLEICDVFVRICHTYKFFTCVTNTKCEIYGSKEQPAYCRNHLI